MIHSPKDLFLPEKNTLHSYSSTNNQFPKCVYCVMHFFQQRQHFRTTSTASNEGCFLPLKLPRVAVWTDG